MRLSWPVLAVILLATPTIAGPQVAAVTHPTVATAIPLARVAAAAHDYRVYLDIGLASRSAPGLICADPRARDRLGQRGWNEIPDTETPPHSDAPEDAAELFNRTLAADEGFQAATNCRPLTACETRFEPFMPEGSHWGDEGGDFHLDRRCLSQRGQLMAAVQAGAVRDVDLLLAHAPEAWRRKDARGLDVYDRALIEAARQWRRDVVVRLLPRVSTGHVGVNVPERSIEAAMVAALTRQAPDKAGHGLAIARLLRAQGARLSYRKEVNVSLLTEVLGGSSRGPERLRIVDWLLAIGADPNGPPCGGQGDERSRGYEPLQWALGDEAVFDRLVAAGARVRDAPCKTADGNGGQTLTWRAIRGFEHLGPGFEERRRTVIKLLRMGGRVRSWGQDPVSVSGANLEALSIMVAAAQLDGARDAFLKSVIAGSENRFDGAPTTAQARVWLACRHGDPILLADRALLCEGEE